MKLHPLLRILSASAVGGLLSQGISRADSFVVQNLSDSGDGSLRNALNLANSSEGPHQISFGSLTGTIVLESSLPLIESNVSIIGSGEKCLTISGGMAVRPLDIGPSASVSISGLTLSGGYAAIGENGGAIRNSGELSLSGCTLIENRASGGFGGAVSTSGDLTIEECRFISNTATGAPGSDWGSGGGVGGGGAGLGGAIFSTVGSLIVRESVFHGNSAFGGRGDSTLSESPDPGNGGRGGGPDGGEGGLKSDIGPGEVGSEGGFGSGGGGGGYGATEGGNGGNGGFGGGGGGGAAAANSDWSDLTSGIGGTGGFGGGRGAGNGTHDEGHSGGGGAGFGGAIFLKDGSITLSRSVVSGNSAIGGESADFTTSYHNRGPAGGAGAGAGLFVHDGSAEIEEVHFEGNIARGANGGIGFVSGEAGWSGGAAVYCNAGSTEISRSAITANTATGGNPASGGRFRAAGGTAIGGGLSIIGGSLTVTNSTLSANRAIGGNGGEGGGDSGIPGRAIGGAAANDGATLTLTSCTVTGNGVQPGLPGNNHSYASGGGLSCGVGGVSLHHSILSDNLILNPQNGDLSTPSDGSGEILSDGHNLIEQPSGMTGIAGSDITGSSPELGPLQMNGGPTPTHAISTASPALDAGDASEAPQEDQRGLSRPQGDAPDIGSYERESLTILIDGMATIAESATRSPSAELAIEMVEPVGTILYSLDGSEPGLGSTLYTGPITLTESSVVRVVAYDSEFNVTATAGPLELTINPLRTLEIEITGNGSVTRTPPEGTLPDGSTVTLVAIADEGWVFEAWSGDITCSNPTVEILLDSNKQIHATFAQISVYPLILTKTGAGSVTTSPAGGSYESGTIVSLTANAAEGYYFDGWSGDITDPSPEYQVLMDGPKSITANFSELFTLRGSTDGGGAVNIDPSESYYLPNTTVGVEAVPNPGWSFLSWIGDLGGSNANLEVPVTSHLEFEAVFGTTIQSSISGAGNVTFDPAGPTLPYGTKLRLNATPNSGNYFAFWGEPINKTSPSVEVQVTNANPTLPAVFLPLADGEHSFTLHVNGEGSVTASTPGTKFNTGQSVVLLATPSIGQTFVGWSGGLDGNENPATVTIEESLLITANFTSLPTIEAETKRQAMGQTSPKLTLQGRIGDVYEIWKNSDLNADWIHVDDVTNSYGKVIWIDSGAGTDSKCFYRAQMDP